MQLYTCNGCGNQLYFENVFCQRCGATLGFVPDQLKLLAFENIGENLWKPIQSQPERWYRMCPNYYHQQVCNWMVAVDDHEAFCVSCRLNHVIPNLSNADNKVLWHRLEVDKRYFVYAMLRLGLPIAPRRPETSNGLAFEFLADVPFSGRKRVLIGHSKGLITINIAEADPVTRERMRAQMNEPYRTILGHFRHESGHYYWDRLIRHTYWLEGFRQLFGDENRNYRQALERHYQFGAPLDWQNYYISAYASSHPWEDWAETWAHYLHIIDTLETAGQFDLRVVAAPQASSSLHDFNAYEQQDFSQIMDNWFPLATALNAINRSMGQDLLYPFVINPPVIEKMRFIHQVIHAQGGRH